MRLYQRAELYRLTCKVQNHKPLVIKFDTHFPKPKTNSRGEIAWKALPNHVRDLNTQNSFKAFLRDHPENQF